MHQVVAGDERAGVLVAVDSRQSSPHPAPGRRSVVDRWWLGDRFAPGPADATARRIDVLVLRPDLPRLREQLAGWDLHAADPPGTLRPWPVTEELPPGVHNIWCRPAPTTDWCLQLMVDDLVHGGGGGEREWMYRRDPRVRRAWRTLSGPASTLQRSVLAPEVQLLYRSMDPPTKDEADFAHIAEVLDSSRRSWLIEALQLTAATHPWIEHLRTLAGS